MPGPLVSQSMLCFMSVHSKVILDPLKKLKINKNLYNYYLVILTYQRDYEQLA